MITNKRQQNNKKKRNNNKWPHPTLTIIYSRFLGMFNCDIESYCDFESYCRIHSLFKLLIVSFLAYFSKRSSPARFLNIFKPLQGLKVYETQAGRISPGPRSRNFWKIRIFGKFLTNVSTSFTSFKVFIKHCNGLKGFYNQTCAVPGSPELKPFKHCSV